MKAKKFFGVLLVLVIAAGLVLTVYGGSKIAHESKILRDWQHSEAVVSRLESDAQGIKHHMLQYSAEGETYDLVYDQANEDTYIGEYVALYYEPGNASNYYLKLPNNNKLLLTEGLILLCGGLFIALFTVVPAIKKRILIRKNKWAMCKVTKVKKKGKNAKKIYLDSSKFPKRKGKPFVSAAYRGKLPKNIKESSLMVYYSEKFPFIYYVETDKLS